MNGQIYCRLFFFSKIISTNFDFHSIIWDVFP